MVPAVRLLVSQHLLQSLEHDIEPELERAYLAMWAFGAVLLMVLHEPLELLDRELLRNFLTHNRLLVGGGLGRKLRTILLNRFVKERLVTFIAKVGNEDLVALKELIEAVLIAV